MLKNWRKLSSEPATDLKVFSLKYEQYESPRTGAPLRATILEAASWVNVIALTPKRECVMIRQFRFGTERLTLEIPGGVVDRGEQPLAAAQRELREETGYSAERWTSLGRVAPNPAFQRNYLYTYLAEGCTPAGEQLQDPGEDIEVVLTPLSEVRSLIGSEEFDHALVLVAFLKLEQHISF
jgi:8-oxo-dGTP pyrophosphatase MutT (NUDIX family)